LVWDGEQFFDQTWVENEPSGTVFNNIVQFVFNNIVTSMVNNIVTTFFNNIGWGVPGKMWALSCELGCIR
jgi:hypothetical protein